MKPTVKMLLSLTVTLMTASVISCHKIEEWDNDAPGNFEALWKVVDEHYCFFGDKDIDWQKIYEEYRPQVNRRTTNYELFDICAEMLSRLEDGHVNLSSSFQTSYYRKWWSDYPQNYDERLVQQYYLGFNYLQVGGVYYAILPENVGYIRWGSFQSTLGEGNLDQILYHFRNCLGLIIDIRDNGGGMMTSAETLVSRFLSEKTLAGYISHKTGPGHNDFSEPYAFYYTPPGEDRITWHKPVAVLVNRSTFSAANHFTAVMKYLPSVYIVGDRTGGGSGMPLSLEIPNGWSIRMSACSLLDPKGVSTETGIEPTPGCKVDIDPQLATQGIDTMLDLAINKVTAQ